MMNDWCKRLAGQIRREWYYWVFRWRRCRRGGLMVSGREKVFLDILRYSRRDHSLKLYVTPYRGGGDIAGAEFCDQHRIYDYFAVREEAEVFL